jgi:hypothetical protein
MTGAPAWVPPPPERPIRIGPPAEADLTLPIAITPAGPAAAERIL